MISKKILFSIIIIFIIINILLTSGCSNKGETQKIPTIEKNVENENKTNNYNVNLEDLNKIQSSLNFFLISTINEEGYIDILNGKYTYNDNNELIYVFAYNLYSLNNELKTSSNMGFATASKITCINLVNKDPYFSFTEDALIEFIENNKQSNESNSIKIETMLYNSKENKSYDYILTFRIKDEIDHEIKIELLN